MKFVMVILIAAAFSPFEVLAQTAKEDSTEVEVTSQLAQRSRSQRRQRVRERQEPSQQSRHRARRTRAYPKLGASYKYWNERIEGRRAGAVSDIEMQFTGLSVHHSYNRYFLRSRWRRVYGLELAGGLVKGKGTSGIIGDGLKDQPWMALTATAALVRRVSAASEIGFGVPLSYRFIFWKLKDGQFSMEKENSYSVGGEIFLLNNISSRSAIRVAVAQQYQWETTLFTVGWEWRPEKFPLSRFF